MEAKFKEAPDQDGYYWLLQKGTNRAMIVLVTGKMAKSCTAQNATETDRFKGVWWGPLPCPFEKAR